MKELFRPALVLLLLSAFAAIVQKPVRRVLRNALNSTFMRLLVLFVYVLKAERHREFQKPRCGPAKLKWVKNNYQKRYKVMEAGIDETIAFLVDALNVAKCAALTRVKDGVQEEINKTIEE